MTKGRVANCSTEWWRSGPATKAAYILSQRTVRDASGRHTRKASRCPSSVERILIRSFVLGPRRRAASLSPQSRHVRRQKTRDFSSGEVSPDRHHAQPRGMQTSHTCITKGNRVQDNTPVSDYPIHGHSRPSERHWSRQCPIATSMKWLTS